MKTGLLQTTKLPKLAQVTNIPLVGEDAIPLAPQRVCANVVKSVTFSVNTAQPASPTGSNQKHDIRVKLTLYCVTELGIVASP